MIARWGEDIRLRRLEIGKHLVVCRNSCIWILDVDIKNLFSKRTSHQRTAWFDVWLSPLPPFPAPQVHTRPRTLHWWSRTNNLPYPGHANFSCFCASIESEKCGAVDTACLEPGRSLKREEIPLLEGRGGGTRRAGLRCGGGCDLGLPRLIVVLGRGLLFELWVCEGLKLVGEAGFVVCLVEFAAFLRSFAIMAFCGGADYMLL